MKRVASDITVINTETGKENSTTFIKPTTSRLYTEEVLSNRHPHKTTALPTAAFTKPRFAQLSNKKALYFYIPVSSQLQLRAPFSCPEGFRSQELPLYKQSRTQCNRSMENSWQQTLINVACWLEKKCFGKINGTFRRVMEARMRHSVCWKTIKCITINQYHDISQVN